MPKGFVMIDVKPGHEQLVREGLQKIAGVRMAYQVTGEPDIVAFIDTEPYANFAHLIASIRAIAHVIDTDTLLVLEGEGEEG